MFCVKETPADIATIFGSFNGLQQMHKENVRIAFQCAKRVLIYVASDEYVSKKLTTFQSYQLRVERLKNFILEIANPNSFEIRCLNADNDLRTAYLENDELRTANCISIISPPHYHFFQTINDERVRQKKSKSRQPNFLILVKPRTYEYFQVDKSIATIGGTFNKLHRGHKEYIKLAFDYSKNVLIYLNSDQYAAQNKEHPINCYKKRENELTEYIECYIKEHQLERSYDIRCLNSKKELKEDFLYNVNLRERISMVMVVPEYYETFSEINMLRQRSRLKYFLILVKQRTLFGRFDISSTVANDYYNPSASIAD